VVGGDQAVRRVALGNPGPRGLHGKLRCDRQGANNTARRASGGSTSCCRRPGGAGLGVAAWRSPERRMAAQPGLQLAFPFSTASCAGAGRDRERAGDLWGAPPAGGARRLGKRQDHPRCHPASAWDPAEGAASSRRSWERAARAGYPPRGWPASTGWPILTCVEGSQGGCRAS
jgi:hypothetical protein